VILFVGKLGNVSYPFYVLARRGQVGTFSFGTRSINLIIDNYPSINFQQDFNEESNFQCLTAKLNNRTKKFDLKITDCLERHTIICQKINFVKPKCAVSNSFRFGNKNPFSLLLDPATNKLNKLATAYKRAEITYILKWLDQSAAYQSIFKTVWYSALPCFDIRNITAYSNGASALLQYCEWKGIPISCSAIFTTFPTDLGMCCSFNMKAADDIYVKSKYRDMLQAMQGSDKKASFLSSTLPNYYVENGEPKTIPGRNKGLVLMLDTHSDWLASSSMDADFKGFTAFVQSSGSFPLMSQEGLQIKPGYNNIITLTSSIVNADESLRSLDKQARNCLFPDENTGLKLHKKYTYLNCKFECKLFYTQGAIAKKYNKTCQPWFFPSSSDSISICDPWQSFDFLRIIKNEIPDNLCSHCLPDCSVTIYNPTITVQPFDKCSANNIGVSRFCSINLKQILPMQMRLVNQIQKEFYNTSAKKLVNVPDYILSLKSSIRNYGYNVFKKSPNTTYDALDRDIAMVKILYQKSTAVSMGSQLALTWIDYFSAVGGLLGLVLGMGFVSFIELFWLCLRMLAFKLNMKKWIY
jgi:hypothetical protein